MSIPFIAVARDAETAARMDDNAEEWPVSNNFSRPKVCANVKWHQRFDGLLLRIQQWSMRHEKALGQ
jgi:hypothetical protein